MGTAFAYSRTKQQRLDDSERWRCLELFQRNKKVFFMWYVTIDETWIHPYTPESNRQSAQWTVEDENRPERSKTQISVGKVLFTVFWDAHGILFINFLEKGRTINCEYYMALLVRFKWELQKTTPNGEEKSALSPRQYTVSQVDRNNGKIARIALQIASPTTVFSGSHSQQLLPVCRPKKNAPGKEIWL